MGLPYASELVRPQRLGFFAACVIERREDSVAGARALEGGWGGVCDDSTWGVAGSHPYIVRTLAGPQAESNKNPPFPWRSGLESLRSPSARRLAGGDARSLLAGRKSSFSEPTRAAYNRVKPAGRFAVARADAPRLIDNHQGVGARSKPLNPPWSCRTRGLLFPVLQAASFVPPCGRSSANNHEELHDLPSADRCPRCIRRP